MSDMVKRRLSLFVSVALAILVAGPGNGVLSAEMPRGGDVGCKWPINPDETGQSILKRYGKQASVAVIADLDGEQAPGLLLYPEDPKLHLEISWFGDVIRTKPKGLRLVEKNSKWTVFGLRVGMTLEEVAAANGGSLELWGFEQLGDGGRKAAFGDFRPGKLEGGCKVTVVFMAAEENTVIPEPLYGLQHIASDNPELLKLKPILTDLLLSWDQPLPE
jgi:hypothetical protein